MEMLRLLASGGRGENEKDLRFHSQSRFLEKQEWGFLFCYLFILIQIQQTMVLSVA